MSIWSHEYEDKIEKYFLGNKKTPVTIIFGFKNDSYELRLNDDLIQYDIFLTYKYNSTHMWCGYQLQLRKFRY